MTTPLAPSPASTNDPLLERLRASTVGTYDIAGELGRGGMAVVYLAHDLKLDRRVAIKVMDPRLSLTPGMSDRFLLEARIAARLQHPGIIIVHDIRQDHDLSYFVMSYVEGMATDELCQRSEPLPFDDARWIIAGAARALAHAHGEGIVHRDVKPANILVNVKGEVILTDFGIAKALGGASLTQTGTQVGTPSYMSPEQFSERPVGPPSDQYALGITAYHLLTGRLPFGGELYQLIVAHNSQAPTPLQQLRPDCPAFLADAVLRMLAKDPEQRWPSLHDVADVFAANLPADGGPARRSLAATALQAHQARAQHVPALQALTPRSPVPFARTAAPVVATAPAAVVEPTPTPAEAPSTAAPKPAEPVIAELRLPSGVIEMAVGTRLTLPVSAFDAQGTPLAASGLDVLLDRPDALHFDAETLQIEARTPGDTRLIIAPRRALTSGTTPAVRATCVIRVTAVREVTPEILVAAPVVPVESPIVLPAAEYTVASVARDRETTSPATMPAVEPQVIASSPAGTTQRLPAAVRVGLPVAAFALVALFMGYRQMRGPSAPATPVTTLPAAAPTADTSITSAPPPSAASPAPTSTANADSIAQPGKATAPNASTAKAPDVSRVSPARPVTPTNAPNGRVQAPTPGNAGTTQGASTAPAGYGQAGAANNTSNSAANNTSTNTPTNTAAKVETPPEPTRSVSYADSLARVAAVPSAPAAAAPTAEAPRAPTAADMRQAASDLFNALRATKGASVREIATFFRDGNDHRMTLGAVKVLDPRGNIHRAQFELQVSKRDFSGRLAAGMALVTFIAERRDGQIAPALESVGPLARSR
jgi:hypothetical protein